MREAENKPITHRVVLPIHFSEAPWLEVEGKSCPRCKSPLRNAHIEHTFGWGDTKRLECVVKDTPALKCNHHTYLQAHAVWPIKEMARAIRKCFEFGKQEDFDTIAAFLSPTDVNKVRDFADALTQEPFFIRKAENHGVNP